MNIIVELEHFEGPEITEGMVSEAMITELKKTDLNPTVKYFTIAHEGRVTGHNATTGRKVDVHYLRDAIQKIGEKVSAGVQCFIGHNRNDPNRKSVGKVISTRLVEVAGKLNAIVAVYLGKEYANEKLDVASIETNVAMKETPDGVQVSEVRDVTGIALGDGRRDRPGFPGATLIHAMQHFKGEDDMATKAEVRAAIAENGWSPSDFFPKEALKADKFVTELISEGTGEVQKIVAERDKTIGDLTKSTEEKDVKIKELSGQVFKSKGVDLMKSKVAEKKFGDKQNKFFDEFSKGFTYEGEEKGLDKAVDDFIGKAETEYKRVATIFGEKFDDDRSAPPGDRTPGVTNTPDANPLIPK